MDIQAFVDKRYQWDGEGMSNFPDDVKEFVELVRCMHYAVATSDNYEIAHYLSDVYMSSKNMFLAAIRLAYPEWPAEDIYQLWVECDTSIAYCVDVLKHREEDESDNECEGHESLRGDMMGESIYCDGSCKI